MATTLSLPASGGSGGDTGGMARRWGSCCCQSWLNIVPGSLGNPNRSGEEMKLLVQTRRAWQGSRLRDKVLRAPCQPAGVIY